MMFQSSEFQNIKKTEAIGVNNMIRVCQVSPWVSYIIYIISYYIYIAIYIYIHISSAFYSTLLGGVITTHTHTESTRQLMTCPG